MPAIPVACAAALAVLDVIEEEKLLERADAIGPAHRGAARGAAAPQRPRCRSPPFAGRGRWSAFEIVKERGSDRRRIAEQTKQRDDRALEKGLVLLSCGTNVNTIRILVPLTATDAIIDEGMGMLEKSLAA